ncbi:MAG: photosynthetic complex assembly protein PuhC [Pseudomonadota bacterium]
MSENTEFYAPKEKPLVPPVLLWGVTLMVLSVCAVVVFATLTGRPPEATPPAGDVVAERDIVVTLAAGGGAVVRDGTTGADTAPVAALPAGEGGFVSGYWRALTYQRSRHGVDPSLPVTLQRYADGRLSILDPHTGWRFHMQGFGRDNIASFAALLEDGQ